MISNWSYKHNQAAAYLKSKFLTAGFQPHVMLILGSGFKDILKSWDTVIEIPMAEIPAYPCPSVQGHGRSIVGGRFQHDRKRYDVMIATGRSHMYEGHSPEVVTFPCGLAHAMNIQSMILTNAAGGVSPKAQVGSIVVIEDQLNLTGRNVAAAASTSDHAQFVDMYNAFDRAWREAVCQELKLPTGVYAGLYGATYETPAETKMLQVLGADMVGMSTVQEVIAARSLRQSVFGCSFITNQSGASGSAHDEVLKAVSDHFSVVKAVLELAVRLAPN